MDAACGGGSCGWPVVCGGGDGGVQGVPGFRRRLTGGRLLILLVGLY
uniref:Uncharacterized protein n=1 Tax=Siphoviridae sp. ctZF426 TaxID=2827580 RepID=A0A8S5RSG2_9CAUD|nr:MAG TPA: hypothetical protein [Siphoviridae sp. ctZF426]